MSILTLILLLIEKKAHNTPIIDITIEDAPTVGIVLAERYADNMDEMHTTGITITDLYFERYFQYNVINKQLIVR